MRVRSCSAWLWTKFPAFVSQRYARDAAMISRAETEASFRHVITATPSIVAPRLTLDPPVASMS